MGAMHRFRMGGLPNNGLMQTYGRCRGQRNTSVEWVVMGESSMCSTGTGVTSTNREGTPRRTAYVQGDKTVKAARSVCHPPSTHCCGSQQGMSLNLEKWNFHATGSTGNGQDSLRSSKVVPASGSQPSSMPMTEHNIDAFNRTWND